ncbi:hypothetical protein EFK03_22645, partial [Escherichia coli]|nr:hypothetical protein [Escherichia coli]
MCIALLCSLLRFAYQSGFISTKPFEGVKKLQRNRIKPDPLSKTEFNALMESEKEPRQPGGCKLKTAPVRPVVAARPAE